jgi:hypothetical protein
MIRAQSVIKILFLVLSLLWLTAIEQKPKTQPASAFLHAHVLSAHGLLPKLAGILSGLPSQWLVLKQRFQFLTCMKSRHDGSHVCLLDTHDIQVKTYRSSE